MVEYIVLGERIAAAQDEMAAQMALLVEEVKLLRSKVDQATDATKTISNAVVTEKPNAKSRKPA